eukprot:CAMPEP_0206213716 /NCGR_PEP_ID=MMETSP0047_2-20121206/1270_1 /ASSEMBLY_ACC=CAM_ASM_000192 /TAXON_ID=195065 /ORGANISM="Chroomonas mesostigmatica_cf, Strain CCMP1168" /LENGTH=36 /DNA_ID= /DNA_START= /DNA_END= /DNA_ORIENTATION=
MYAVQLCAIVHVYVCVRAWHLALDVIMLWGKAFDRV